MAVNEALSALSQTSASNTPAGDDPIGTDLDNHLRDIKKNIRYAANWPVQTAKTMAYTVLVTDMHEMVRGDTSGGAFDITLPVAATAGDGFELLLKKSDSSTNALTIEGDSAETINGELNLVLLQQYDGVHLICDGSNWHTAIFNQFLSEDEVIALAVAL